MSIQQRQLSSDDRWRQLVTVQAPQFDAPALEWQGVRVAHSALQAVRAQHLSGLYVHDWAAGEAALDAFIGSSNGHCFSAEPHAWLDLLEPQITKGLAHFLNAGGHGVRSRRILALLQAVRATPSAQVDIAPEDVVGACAIAEAQCGAKRRIDLVAWVHLTDGRRFGTVIEAKVGHEITRGQLACYETAADKKYLLKPEGTTFIVVAPALTEKIVKQLQRRPAWTFMSWRALLTRLGGVLAAGECDLDDFVRFRHTVWSAAA